MDRNIILQKINIVNKMSLSARRAWIEIYFVNSPDYNAQVALRKESVDRNLLFKVLVKSHRVALRKESVDRNMVFLLVRFLLFGRSPQGERG